jgi:putative transposase
VVVLRKVQVGADVRRAGVDAIDWAIGGGRVADPPLRMQDSQLPNRKSIRWRGYDYSSAGIYFVTICAFERRSIFGSISSGVINPSLIGRIVSEHWFDLPKHFVGLELDAFVVMPNHIHGILLLNSLKSSVIEKPASGDAVVGAGPRPARRRPKLPDIIGEFKRFSALKINSTRGITGQPVWQRNYFERVVRDGKEMEKVQRYIGENPMRWEFDRENPEAVKPERLEIWERE